MGTELQVRIGTSGREAEMSQEGPQAGARRGGEAIIDAAGWTLGLFVLSLPLVVGFSPCRRTRSIEPDERDSGGGNWLP